MWRLSRKEWTRNLDRDLLTSEFLKTSNEVTSEFLKTSWSLFIAARLRSVLWDLVEYPETSRVGF